MATTTPLPVQLLAIALAVGGAFGFGGTFFLFDSVWVWAMPDLAYRFLSAASMAYVCGGCVALWRRHPAAYELLMATVVLYGLPLLLATQLEREAIDWRAPITLAFLGIVTAALAICAIYLPRLVRRPVDGNSLSRLTRIALAMLAAAALVTGAIVFVAPREAGWVWPWAELGPWKLLDSRLLASMLLTIGGSAGLLAIRHSRAGLDVFTSMLVAYASVAIVGLLLHAERTPAFRTDDLAYCSVFAAVSALFILVWLLEYRRSTRFGS